MSDLYLIRCAGGEQRDDCLWWRPSRSGYTAFIDEAGRYTKEEAESICRSRPYEDVPVPENLVLPLTKRIVRRDQHSSIPMPPRRPPAPKVPQRCYGCGQMRPHDANPYENCDSCEEREREKREQDARFSSRPNVYCTRCNDRGCGSCR